jgi:hypothetical protein
MVLDKNLIILKQLYNKILFVCRLRNLIKFAISKKKKLFPKLSYDLHVMVNKK